MNPRPDVRSDRADRAAVCRAAFSHVSPRAAAIVTVLLVSLLAVAGTAAGTAENSIPGTPTAVKASRGETGTVAVLTWDAAPADAGVSSYRVWRAEDDGGFSVVASVRTATFTDKIGVPGASYRYQVSACNADGGESLPSASTATITVEWTLSPHYRAKAADGSSFYCRVCHVSHSAEASESLLRADNVRTGEVAVCFRCHDGSGALANIASGPSDSFGLASGHTVEGSLSATGTDLTNSCGDCHHLHANAASQTALRPLTITGEVIGTRTVDPGVNGWCLACHDAAGSWYVQKYGSPYPTRVTATRDGQGYPLYGSFPGPGTYNDPAANEHAAIPASAEYGMGRGDCLFCHAAHRGASRYDGLRAVYRPTDSQSLAADQQTGAYAALCFVCHGGARPSYLQTVPIDIKRYVTSGSRNAGHRIISDNAALPFGAPLPCYDCHNPHGSGASAFGLEVLTSTGPTSTTVVGDAPGEIVAGAGATPADVRRFCLACHTTSDTGVGWDGSAMAPVAPGALVEGVDRVSFDGVLRLPEHESHTQADPRSCNECHGGSYETADSFNVHNPNPGRPSDEAQCDTCHDAEAGATAVPPEPSDEPSGVTGESAPETASTP